MFGTELKHEAKHKENNRPASRERVDMRTVDRRWLVSRRLTDMEFSGVRDARSAALTSAETTLSPACH